ncbi:MAG: HlyC/CorC family transporter [Candidatus Tectomicrobia bacterium]|uniref:HlyC/CorC family transporter n=1 Tax=Tectimicrobiota bacterium TaxID=2528274 RepID=A0A932CR33_UNCTE|nr:HlyC/CorC family transporter [Candidatus Tectomicrobia bacterium]
MTAVVLEVLFVVLLIIVNGVFAMSEIAIVSARKARLQQRAEEGNLGARMALELANAPSRFLATIQIGITLVGVLAGAFGGATLAEKLAVALRPIQPLAPYSEAMSIGLVVLGITYLSLVVGELVPKHLALNHAEQVASAVASPMRALSVVAAPFVHLLSLSTEAVLRVLGTRPSSEPQVTEEEIKIMIEQGTEVGVFHPAEQEMVRRVFRLGDLKVEALMTPRTEIVWLDLQDPPEENQRKITTSGHSRFPVAQGSLDNVRGLIHVRDLLARSLTAQPVDLEAVVKPALFVPEGLPALTVLERLKSARSQIALVIDEYGGLQGLVTANDILGALVGDVPSVDGWARPEAIHREDGSWLLDGMLPIDEFKEILHLRELPEEEEGHYRTVGGLVMTSLGRIPSEGDHFDWEGFRFEVVDMDGYRVDKVLAMPLRMDSSGTIQD